LFDQRSLAQIGRSMTWYEGHLEKLRLVAAEPQFFRAALRSRDGHNALINFVARYTCAEYRKTLVSSNQVTLTADLEFQIKAWSLTAAETAREWVMQGMPVPPEELAALQDSCVPRDLYSAVNESVLQRRSQAAA
jgi:hypothetical protein